jgi:ATP-dependent Clp protease ATP-binding subunit ClpA
VRYVAALFDAHAGHNYIGTEHILLGLLREGEGVAARVLETLGADPSKIRTQVQYADCSSCVQHSRLAALANANCARHSCLSDCLCCKD